MRKFLVVLFLACSFIVGTGHASARVVGPGPLALLHPHIINYVGLADEGRIGNTHYFNLGFNQYLFTCDTFYVRYHNRSTGQVLTYNSYWVCNDNPSQINFSHGFATPGITWDVYVDVSNSRSNTVTFTT